jgi:hypothetical protein
MSPKEKSLLHKCLLIFRSAFLFSLISLSSIPLHGLAQGITNIFPIPQELLSSRAPSDKSAVKVPFDLYGNNILVQVKINNSQPMWFVFDSGASVNVINERSAKRLGLTSKGNSTLDANGGMATGSFIEETTISLADVKASHQTIVAVQLDALAEYSGRDVQGLIGNNFIQNFVVEIDYAHRILVFHNPQNYNLANEPNAIALENHDGTPFIKAELSLDGTEIITDSFEIDTGSNGIFSLNKPFAEKNRILQVVPKTSIAEGAGGAGVGGELRSINARINSIKIGEYTLNKPVISILEDISGNAANHLTGFLGSDLLRRFTVILDYQSQRMLLRPNADFNEPFEVDLSGLELVTEANNYRVIKIKQVRANFPAAKAGLREGDIISVVNGRAAAEYGLDKLMKMFKQDGKECRLIIKRGDKVIRVKLKLKKII